jgi:hypothetical protein
MSKVEKRKKFTKIRWLGWGRQVGGLVCAATRGVFRTLKLAQGLEKCCLTAVHSLLTCLICQALGIKDIASQLVVTHHIV